MRNSMIQEVSSIFIARRNIQAFPGVLVSPDSERSAAEIWR
jgi:hypothetical protein